MYLNALGRLIPGSKNEELERGKQRSYQRQSECVTGLSLHTAIQACLLRYHTECALECSL